MQYFQEDGIHTCFALDESALEGLRNEKSLHHGRVSSKRREGRGSCDEPIHVYEVGLEKRIQVVIQNH